MPTGRQSRRPAKSKRIPKKKNTSGKRRSVRAKRLIDASMPVVEIVALHQDAATVLAQYGLACANCALGGYESLAEGWGIHGLPDEDLRNLLDDLNALLAGEPLPSFRSKDEHLTLTGSAAAALENVGKDSGKNTCILRVLEDGQGGYCLEFTDRKSPKDIGASNPGYASVSLVADPALLRAIGGATVDCREGRFKLDIGKVPGKSK